MSRRSAQAAPDPLWAYRLRTHKQIVQATLAANQARMDPEPLQERRQAFTDRKTEPRDLPDPWKFRRRDRSSTSTARNSETGRQKKTKGTSADSDTHDIGSPKTPDDDEEPPTRMHSLTDEDMGSSFGVDLRKPMRFARAPGSDSATEDATTEKTDSYYETSRNGPSNQRRRGFHNAHGRAPSARRNISELRIFSRRKHRFEMQLQADEHVARPARPARRNRFSAASANEDGATDSETRGRSRIRRGTVLPNDKHSLHGGGYCHTHCNRCHNTRLTRKVEEENSFADRTDSAERQNTIVFSDDEEPIFEVDRILRSLSLNSIESHCSDSSSASSLPAEANRKYQSSTNNETVVNSATERAKRRMIIKDVQGIKGEGKHTPGAQGTERGGREN